MKKYCRCIGSSAIMLGTAVILALVMPDGFWYFAVGVLLIVCGVFICRRRR